MVDFAADGGARTTRLIIAGRRSDAGHTAEVLAGALRAELGGADVATELGAPRAQRGAEPPKASAVVLLIGPNFLGEIEPATKTRRIEGVEDPLRNLLEAAIALGAPVLPVLLDETAPAPASHWPPSLKRIARTAPRRLSRTRFAEDAARLAQAIRGQLDAAPPGPSTPPARRGESLAPRVPRIRVAPEPRDPRALRVARAETARTATRVLKTAQRRRGERDSAARIAVWLAFIAILAAPMIASFVLYPMI